MAISSSKDQISLVFFDRLGVRLDFEAGRPVSQCIWEVIPENQLLRVIRKVASGEISTDDWELEVSDSDYEKIELTYDETLLLMHLACMRPEMLDYIIEILGRRTPTLTTKNQLILAAIDLIPFKFGSRLLYLSEDIGWPPRENTLYVLKRLLGFGADPSQTNLWRTVIWNAVDLKYNDLDGDQLVQTFEILLSAGADAEITFTHSFMKTVMPPKAHSNLDIRIVYATKPLDLAFWAEKVTIFCILLQKAKDLESFIWKIISYSSESVVVLPEFILAVRARDANRVKELWNHRFQYLGQDTFLLSRQNRFDTAKEILLRYKAKSEIIGLVEGVTSAITANGHSTNDADEMRVRGLELLISLVTEGVCFLDIPEFREADCIGGYNWSLRTAAEKGNTELLKILLDIGFGISQDSSIYLEWQRIGVNPVPHAARYSLGCLKILIERGFSIRRPAPNEYKSSVTALEVALESGNLKILSYVLREGANIHAPCDQYSTAIEYAIKLGRIDALALLLEIDGTSHGIALALVSKSVGVSKYIKDYVHNWRKVPDLPIYDTTLQFIDDEIL
ncbi:hypothetical protein TWF694_005054 [Orbilia ellipsospora]|uniref:Ankyrin repeat protein n=1 Tax=Orbilia ellipsospora TaxID=2528407 RepID=A0AAV9WUG7_9PEZI